MQVRLILGREREVGTVEHSLWARLESLHEGQPELWADGFGAKSVDELFVDWIDNGVSIQEARSLSSFLRKAAFLEESQEHISVGSPPEDGIDIFENAPSYIAILASSIDLAVMMVPIDERIHFKDADETYSN
jgi:hypothetical protein